MLTAGHCKWQLACWLPQPLLEAADSGEIEVLSCGHHRRCW